MRRAFRWSVLAARQLWTEFDFENYMRQCKYDYSGIVQNGFTESENEKDDVGISRIFWKIQGTRRFWNRMVETRFHRLEFSWMNKRSFEKSKHRAACANVGVLGRRGFALESAAARQFYGSASSYLWEDEEGVVHRIVQAEEENKVTPSCRLSSLLASIQHSRPCRPRCKMGNVSSLSWMMCTLCAHLLGSTRFMGFCSVPSCLSHMTSCSSRSSPFKISGVLGCCSYFVAVLGRTTPLEWSTRS